MALHRDFVLVVVPGHHPALPGGCGAGAGSGTLGVLTHLHADPATEMDLLANSAWELDSVAAWPIEFAARYGNCRLDLVVASGARPSGAAAGPDADIAISGAGLVAVGTAVQDNDGVVVGPQDWRLGRFNVHAVDAEARIRAGGEPTEHWLSAAQAGGLGLDGQTVAWLAVRGGYLRAAGVLSGPLLA